VSLTPEIWQGVAAGIVFGVVNFWLLTRIVKGMVASETVSKWKTPLFFILKIGLLILTIGLILEKRYVSPLPFLAGFTVSLVLGIAWKALRNSPDTVDKEGN
jgi:ATP synthase I subunit